MDQMCIRDRGYVTAHSLKVFSDCSDPVGLLYLQFGSILDDGCAFCMGSHNCEDGDLIDQGRDDVPLYRSPFQMTGADQDVRASFAPQEGLIYTGNILSLIHI